MRHQKLFAVGAAMLAPALFLTVLSGANSPVADAAMRGDTAEIRKLITAKADVNAPQPDGSTALHWAVYQTPDGKEAYTRAGDLKLDPAGQLQTASGLAVVGNGGPIVMPASETVAIGKDGTISTRPLGQEANALTQVDRLKLVKPALKDLYKGEDGLFHPRNGQPLAADAGVRLALHPDDPPGIPIGGVARIINMTPVVGANGLLKGDRRPFAIATAGFLCMLLASASIEALRFWTPLPEGEPTRLVLPDFDAMSIDEGHEAAMALFDAGNYFGAHEAWETCWARCKGTHDEEFFKGLSQLGAGYTHWLRGKAHGVHFAGDDLVDDRQHVNLVGDDDSRGVPLTQGLNGVEECGLPGRVEIGIRLVQHNQFWASEHRARQPDALPLARRKIHTVFTHIRFVTLR